MQPHARMRLAVALALAGCAAGGDDPVTASAGGGKADGTGRTFDDYAAIVEASGATVNPGGQTTVVGLRGASIAAHVFDDTFAILTPDHRVLELAGSTHPWESSSTQSPDVDGDGVGDVGTLRPGEYRVVPRSSAQNILGIATYHVTMAGSDRVPGWRDTDHDGVISDAEREASEARGDTLGAILFHAEGPGGPSAIGCQVFSPDTQKQLVARIGAHTFDYVLVDAP